jgi:hypothetical protein
VERVSIVIGQHDPRSVYAARAAAAEQEYGRAVARGERLGLLRLAAFALLLVLLFTPFEVGVIGYVLWVALFGWLVILSGRADSSRRGAESATRWYADADKRLSGGWTGRGVVEFDPTPAGHTYAADLDLFGVGSVFDLLCRAQSTSGRELLGSWLLETADAEEVRSRQAAARELAPHVELREDLVRLGSEISSALARTNTVEWAQGARRLRGWLLPVMAITSSLLLTASLVNAIALDGPWRYVFLALGLHVLAALPWRRRVRGVLEDGERPVRNLLLVGRLGGRLGRATFEAPRLQAAAEQWSATDEEGATHALRHLPTWQGFQEGLQNPFFMPIAWILNVGPLLAAGIEAWRARHGSHVPAWLHSLGEFEALDSLGSHHFERPSDVFPEIVEGPARFEAVALGHPLLPPATCVHNDLTLEAGAPGAQCLLVSGSNMSGKSTLMRAVGVNAALALAGCVVQAEALRLSPLRIGSSLRVQDSLGEGRSRFQAELERIAQILREAKEDGWPMLFLLDEVLGGTNSADRGVGTAALLDAFLAHGAIGLVSTHDLALAPLATERAAMRNVHFRDEIVDGQMHFDHKLHEGVVERSNAVALMRGAGIDV